MPETSLTTPARQALLALLLFGAEAATNPALQERFALKIAKESREQLERARLIAVSKTGNTFFHRLTDKGRDRASEELSTQAPAGTTAGVRLLYAMANVLSNVMAQHGIKAHQVFGGAVDVDVAGPQVQQQIIESYSRLTKRRGAFVSLAKLRESLPSVPWDEMSKALKIMDRERQIQLDPDPNPGALPAEARDSAIRIGGEDKHLMTVVPR